MKKIKLLFILAMISVITSFILFHVGYQKRTKNNYTLEEIHLTIAEAVESIHTLYDVADYIQLDKIKKNKQEILDQNAVKQIFNQLQITQLQKKELLQNLNQVRISRAEWGRVLLSLGEYIGIGEVCRCVETSVFYQNKKEGELVTDDGRFWLKKKGSAYAEMLDKKISSIVRENTIVFVISIESQANFHNVYIKEIEEDFILGLLFGQVRKIKSERIIELESGFSGNMFADVIIEEGKLQAIYLKRKEITGKIQAISEDRIELEGYGDLPLSSYFRFVSENQKETQTETKAKEELVVGLEHIKYIVGNGEVCGAILEEMEKSETISNVKNIRVMLMNTGFQDSFHDVVTITSTGDYNLQFYEKQNSTEIESRKEIVHPYKAGETLALTVQNEILSYSRIRITPVHSTDQLQITSFKRNGKHPSYRGSIEVSVYQGRLVLVNEVSVEEYLYSVVPSEMPSSYGIEALKVQAVCARSYAISHMLAGKLSKYGAHVDDSVNYQVYNNTSETENSIAAVDATKGIVMTQNGTVVHAYFYATSCGSTADGSVWSNQQIPYIQSKYLGTGESPDLMNDEIFTGFIKGKPESFDDESPWYRWRVTLSMETLTKSINHMLYSLYCSNKQQILTLGENGVFESKPIHSVGRVHSISVTKRGRGGIIEELLIKGEQAEVLVLKQGNIRKIINPYGNEIFRSDDSRIDTMTALPSAFFAIEAGNDGNSIDIYGGGYGHGAGMSQTAVRELIASGKTYEEILQFFYPGTALTHQ